MVVKLDFLNLTYHVFIDKMSIEIKEICCTSLRFHCFFPKWHGLKKMELIDGS
jgi:hypothetical protein